MSGKMQFAIGYPGLAQNDPRRFALELIDAYSSDMAGPLFTRIREELGPTKKLFTEDKATLVTVSP